MNSANASNTYLQNELATSKETLSKTTEDLSKTKTELKAAKSTKTGETKLPNGDIQILKVNKNGTRMKQVKSPNGNTKFYEVEQLDGSVRRTEFDEITGKRRITTTNTNENKAVEYDLAGKTSKVSKETKSTAQLLERTREGNTVIEKYSDGTLIKKSKMSETGSRIVKEKDGKILERYEEDFCANGSKNTLSVKYGDKDTIVKSEYTLASGFYRKHERTISTDEFGNKFVSEYRHSTPNGELVYHPTKTNAIGEIIEGESITKYNMPVNAPGQTAKEAHAIYTITPAKNPQMFAPELKVRSHVVTTKEGGKLENGVYRQDSGIITKNVVRYGSDNPYNNPIKPDYINLIQHDNCDTLFGRW